MSAMIAAALLAHLAGYPGQSGDEATLRVEGRCIYSAELEQQAQGATLILCGEVTLSEGSIAFAQRGFAETARFEGTWDGDEFTIARVITRGLGGDREAEGECRVFARGEQVIRLQCTAISGPLGYVANFVVPLL